MQHRNTPQNLFAHDRPAAFQNDTKEMPAVSDRRIHQPDSARADSFCRSLIYVVDDDLQTCETLQFMARAPCVEVVAFNSADEFLNSYIDDGENPRCAVFDACLSDTSGFELLLQLDGLGALLPVIVLATDADVPTVVEFMRRRAFDFLQKPVKPDVLRERVCQALERDTENRKARRRREIFRRRLKSLSKREREVIELLLQAQNTKQIAATMGIDVKTVSRHRARGMRKLGTRNEVELALLASYVNAEPESFSRQAKPAEP